MQRQHRICTESPEAVTIGALRSTESPEAVTIGALRSTESPEAVTIDILHWASMESPDAIHIGTLRSTEFPQPSSDWYTNPKTNSDLVKNRAQVTITEMTNKIC